MMPAFARCLRATLSLAIPIALSSVAFAQGDTGFLRGDGRFNLAASYGIDSYEKFWIGTDKVRDPGVGDVDRESVNLYGAYGLTDDLDVQANASYVRSEADGSADLDTEDDFQDAAVGVKWRFLDRRLGPGGFSVLAAPAVKFPLSDYENNSPVAIGDGQWDYRARGIAHYQFDFGLWVSVESGYDVRSSRPDDEFPLAVTVGYTFFERVTLSPFYTLVDSLGGYDIGEGPFPGTEEDYERIGIGAYVRITDWFGVTGSYKTTLDGKNTGDVDGFTIGTVFVF
jgi:hypothetical protein